MSESVAADVRGILIGDSAIAALAGTRVYPVLLPQAPTLPAITYQFVSGFREPGLDGPPGLNRARVQLDCWASTYMESEALANAVRLALDGFQGGVGGSPARQVQGIFFAAERDLYEPDAIAYRRSVDYHVTYQEEA